MEHIDMLEVGVIRYKVPLDSPRQGIWAKKCGIWRGRVEVGQRVKKDMVLGTICNLLEETQ